MKKITTITTATALLFVAGTVSAQTINTQVNTQEDTSIAETVMIKSDTETQANIDTEMMEKSEDMMDSMKNTAADISLKAENTLDATVETISETAVTVEANIDAGIESAQDAMVKTDSDASITAQVSLSSTDLRAESSTEVSTSSEVNSEAEFKAFAMNKAQSDSNIESVQTGDTYVEVTYKTPVKLFGFIKMNMNQTAKVMVNGSNDREVKVTKAWWSFLTTGDDTAELETSLINKVSDSNGTSFNARAQAEVFDAITTSFSARTEIN